MVITAKVLFICKHCGGTIQDMVASNGDTQTVVCDNDSCGANYEISINCKESE